MTVLQPQIVDPSIVKAAQARFKERGIRLPRLSELADPASFQDRESGRLAMTDPDDADPANLFRVHWYNAADRRNLSAVPDHLELPKSLTGVDARIVVVLGDRFPMVAAHKVLAAYGCLMPRLVTGRFDPAKHRAIWPSTGNYCRGGIAISRIMDCRGVAVLPTGMSRERFEWLERWVTSPDDIIRTFGTESNVKEIYDACNELAKDEENVILNQFNEFGNYVTHRAVTGPAMAAVFEHVKGDYGRASLFVAASGSAGTLAAGDHLKAQYGTKICAVEALECPTLLYNGYGEHNIQGIGDKHVPYIHNVFNTDLVAAVSEAAPDCLNLLFNSNIGQSLLIDRKGVPANVVEGLASLGLSSIANVVAAIKAAKLLKLGRDDVILTVATDGAAMYNTERGRAMMYYFDEGFDAQDAAETYGQYLAGAATDHIVELDRVGRERIFNLGYYTWVEQQGANLKEFDARRHQGFWDGLVKQVPMWDDLVDKFNDG